GKTAPAASTLAGLIEAVARRLRAPEGGPATLPQPRPHAGNGVHRAAAQPEAAHGAPDTIQARKIVP
ncbi:MAG: hypothetical protein J2P50_15720, partial [Hyphomicrobiaceae bacterium]|nr:hypothetical protein [Hyphomicrobiaceae bacterium]